MPHTIPRCPICSNAGWHDRGTLRDCTHCELAIASDAPTDRLRAEIAAALPGADRDHAAGVIWRLSAVALRNAAWALGWSWHGDGWRQEATVPYAVVLGAIGRPADVRVIAGLAAQGFAEAIAVLDGDDPPPAVPVPAALKPHLRIAMRRLEGDFAAQRNHLQSLAEATFGSTAWVLQLDTDERPSPALLDALGWMTEAADRDGLRSIGLPRLNLVDGQPSALFPDIQYRLNHASVRFAGTVHERPVIAFAETTLGLAGAIEHRLDSARVLARSLAYEAMLAGAGRSSDEDALLQPFDPATRLFR